MLIGILSDTHDQLDRARRAVEMLKTAGATTLFHCGDITEPPLVPVCCVLPCYFVLGNNDSDMVPHLEAAMRKHGGTSLGWGGEVELAGKRIAMTHGHLTKEVKPLMAAKPDYLFSGHSHEAFDDLRDGVRRINPGALYRARSFSVALLDLNSGQLEMLMVPR
jgi:putative phosphoesterase